MLVVSREAMRALSEAAFIDINHYLRPGHLQQLRNILDGTQREVIFTASGLEVLWRTIVFVIACIFIIPIPWVLRWYAQWYASQFALAERGTVANA